MQGELVGYPNLAGKPFGHGETAIAIPTIDAVVRSPHWKPQELDSLIRIARHDETLPVLLSDEVLIAMPQREWFENLVGPFEVARRLSRITGDKRVLFTLRDPRRHLRSTWLHHLHEGRTQTYSQFLDRISLDRSEDQGTFAIAALVELYADLFGAENLAAGFMEDYVKNPRDYWCRFGDAFGIDAMERFVRCDGPKLNETILGPVWFEMMVNRALHVYGTVRKIDDIRPVRRWMTRKISRRLAVRHEKFFARHSQTENRLVETMQNDIARVRDLINLI